MADVELVRAVKDATASLCRELGARQVDVEEAGTRGGSIHGYLFYLVTAHGRIPIFPFAESERLRVWTCHRLGTTYNLCGCTPEGLCRSCHRFFVVVDRGALDMINRFGFSLHEVAPHFSLWRAPVPGVSVTRSPSVYPPSTSIAGVEGGELLLAATARVCDLVTTSFAGTGIGVFPTVVHHPKLHVPGMRFHLRECGCVGELSDTFSDTVRGFAPEVQALVEARWPTLREALREAGAFPVVVDAGSGLATVWSLPVPVSEPAVA